MVEVPLKTLPDNSDEWITTRWSLIARLRQWDDHESWRTFFETYWRLIYRFAVRSGLTHTEAEEVVQETVLAVSRKMKVTDLKDGFEAEASAGKFKSWLRTQARWRMLDQLRKRSGPHHLTEELVPDRSPEPDEAEERESGDDRFTSIWNDEWETNVLEGALERLKGEITDKQFQMFFLHVLKQQSPREVAESLGVNVAQVYLVKHRVLPRFRRHVKTLQNDLVF